MIPIFLRFQLAKHPAQKSAEVLINPLDISSVNNNNTDTVTVVMRAGTGDVNGCYNLAITLDEFDVILQDTLRELRLQHR